jgi:DNA-binding NarL/FixJ family response regulator
MIADDHSILRAGLRLLVNAQADMEVVSEASDGEKAVLTARETKPDVALLDLTMPRVGGMKALEKIVRDCRNTRVLVLTMHDDPAYLRSALAAGASGYLLKRAVDAELIAAIRAVHRGGTFVDPRLASILVQDVLAKGKAKAGSKGAGNILSKRELQVLGLVARGYTSAEVAKLIFVGVKTVETYRARIFEKLGLQTRRDLIRFAVQLGLLLLQDEKSAHCRGFPGQGGSLLVVAPIDGEFPVEQTECRLQRCCCTVRW